MRPADCIRYTDEACNLNWGRYFFKHCQENPEMASNQLAWSFAFVNLQAIGKLEMGKLWNLTEAVNAMEDYLIEWSKARDNFMLCPFRETGLKSVEYRWVYWLAMTRVPLNGFGEAFPFFAERFPFGEQGITSKQDWITAFMMNKDTRFCRDYLNNLGRGFGEQIKSHPDPFGPFMDDEAFVERRRQFVHAMITHNYAVRGERAARSPHEEEKEAEGRKSGFDRLAAERPDAGLSDLEDEPRIKPFRGGTPVVVGDRPSPVPMRARVPGGVARPVAVRPRVSPAPRIPVKAVARGPTPQLRQGGAFKAPDPHLAEPAAPIPGPGTGTSPIGPVLALGAFFMLLAFLTDEPNAGR